MNPSELRAELHRIIDEGDDLLILEVHDFINSRHDDAHLTEEQRLDLDLRALRHRKGESKLFTWEEARKMIEDRSKKK